MLVNWAKKNLPRPLVARIKRTFVHGIPDAWDAVTGRRDPLTPPRRLMFVGLGEFRKIGDEVSRQLRDLGIIRPDSAVLDVGSGIGRVARPLTAFLSPAGRYEGIDIDRTGVDWCARNITPRFPNFRFQVSDIYNKYYNPGGKWQASAFRFPFGDGEFDAVVLNSVFTHMFPPDVDNYLKEISRVLKPGGQAYITYFLWNAEAEALTAAGRTSLDFRHALDGYRAVELGAPEQAIALPEEFVLGLYAKHGLEVRRPILYGKWCERSGGFDYQDIVLARK